MVPFGVFIHSILSYILVSCVVVIFAIPALIVLCVPAQYWYDSKLVYWGVHWFYVLMQKASLVPITYKGMEHIPNEPVIFAANHQSSLDIPLLGAIARQHPHLWLAKQELMDTWFLRFILPRVAVLVDMSTPRKGMMSLLKIVNLAYDQKRHIMIFPEGGRFTTGDVQGFYGGFVVLVKKLKRPVIPVYISGANKVYPPNTWWVQRVPITVTVGKPMYMQEDEDDVHFKSRVHQWFLDQVMLNDSAIKM